MNVIDPVYTGPDAAQRLCDYCNASFPDLHIVLVADGNTYAAAGRAVCAALDRVGYTLSRVILAGDHIHADELALGRVLARSPHGTAIFIAVGSGTITDITRYISFRLGMPFISVPTAASVDGYASSGAPLVIEGIKRTHYCRPPLAIFADLAVIREAPAELTAAGVGDMLGKITAAADWRIGRLLRGEPYDQAIAERSLAAAQLCVDSIDEIAARSDEGLKRLMLALVESGRCMIDFGESRPASGAEHHISHLWEMRSLQDGGPEALHGAQVGVAAILTARLYARIRGLERAAVERLPEATAADGRARQEAEIEAAYGPLAPTILRDHHEFLDMSGEQLAGLRRAAIGQWDELQAIAASVPPPQFFERLLKRVEGPTTTAQLGFTEDQAKTGFLYGHYLRDRFTVVKLARLFGLHTYPP